MPIAPGTITIIVATGQRTITHLIHHNGDEDFQQADLDQMVRDGLDQFCDALTQQGLDVHPTSATYINHQATSPE